MPRLLVAGGEGFLGSHVCELFKSKGWAVTSLDNRTKFELSRTDFNVDLARKYNQDFLEGLGVELIEGDIRDEHAVNCIARSCDYIINCAAQPAMTIALECPKYDAEVNILGTVNLLDAGRRCGIPVALCSTIHVYGNGINKDLDIRKGKYVLLEKTLKNIIQANKQASDLLILEMYSQSINEEYPLLSGSITPLHVSKYANELYARAFIESYQSNVFVARLTGIYGPRQFGGEDHGWVANFCIRSIYNRPIKVFGTDKQCRDILYVEDAAKAFLDWFEHCQPSGIYNIGGGVKCLISIKQLLEILNSKNVTLEPARKGDLWYFCCDTTKAKQTFGWQPKTLPHHGLIKLIDWIKENEDLFTNV